MKKKFLLLPLMLMVLGSCTVQIDVVTTNPTSTAPTSTEPTSSDPTSIDPTSTDPTSTEDPSDSSTDPSDTTTDPTVPTVIEEKDEIDPAELNASFDFDVYSLLPKVYSNNYFVHPDFPSLIPYAGFKSGVALYLLDWTIDDVSDYMYELHLLFYSTDDGYFWILNDEYFVGFISDSVNFDDTDYALIIFSYGDPAEKLEIDAETIVELNDIVGFDIYSLLPKIYSNDYDFYDWSDDDYPIDLYLFLDDWAEDDYLDYVDALEALGFEFELGYGYVLGDNLFLMISDTGFGAVINIYLDPNYSPLLQSEVWPADAINDFFGEDIGSLVPSFETETIFVYAARGEGENVELSIMTDCTDPDKVDDYIASLVDAGWAVDDSLADWGFYEAVDPGEDIYLFMYFGNGIISWSFSFN